MAEELAIEKHLDNASDQDDELHLVDLVIVMMRYRTLIIAMPVICGLIAVVASLMMDSIYTSTAKILPPQQQQGAGVSAMLGQLGSLAGAAGVKSPNDLYVGMLESRTVADHLIARFNLKDRYKKSNMDDTRAALSRQREVAVGKKDGMISISADDTDPQFAADLANAHVDELVKLTQTMALTEASQRRVFFEKQMKEAKDQLGNAEVALRTTQERTGMIQPDAQAQAIISSVAQLRGVIGAKEVQLSALRTFATGENPELVRGEQELRTLKAQLAKLDRTAPGAVGDSVVSTREIPKAGVEFVRGMRDVKYYETIFELLSKQFELAKIDEAKDTSLIQVLDKAIPAERRSKPNRSLLVIVAIAGGAILGIVLAFLHAGLRRAQQNPETRKRWSELTTVANRPRR